MHRIQMRGPAGLLLATALLTSATTATVQARDVVTIPLGALVLDFSGSGEVWRYNDTTQFIRTGPGNSCAVTGAGSETLMALSTVGTSDRPGFLDKQGKKWLGIVGPGVDCGRVNVNETLVFTLAGELSDKIFSSVDLALNMKFDAILRAQVYNEGEPVDGGSFNIYSGQSITGAPAGAILCAGGADSSPDNDATNCRTFLEAAGDALHLTVLKGAVGVGGAGSTSTFQIADTFESDGEISCGELTIVAPYVVTNESDPGDGEAVDGAMIRCKRLDNVTPEQDSCEAVNYSLTGVVTASDLSAALLYLPESDDPGNTEKFAFICETWWPEQTAQFTAGSLDLAPTAQKWGPDEVPGVDLTFCEDVVPSFGSYSCFYGPDGVVSNCGLNEIDSVTVPMTLDQVPDAQLGGAQVGCLLDERNKLTDDPAGTVKQYQLWYIQGDYTALRTR